jgi:peptide/nickel transport system ATP-binding protein
VSAVLRIEQLSVRLPAGADRVHAIDKVSLEVPAGELLCLVGESGSGKSILASTVMGLLPGNIRANSGRVLLSGESLLDLAPERLRRLRGERMSMIFQEPMTALNPVMTCGAQIDELLVQHTRMSATERKARALQMLEHVRLPDPQRIHAAYPHQLSGGQRQRIMIAMALILKPALLIADEPTTALDVTTQAEILRLIRELQREEGTAVLFITHDFGVVAEIADRVGVLRLGELVESGPAAEILSHPEHPYTRMLLAAVPSLTARKAPLPETTDRVLRTRGLSKVFGGGGWFRRAHLVRAADAVDIEVQRGETLGIVGESGSGKSTVARMLARLIEPSAGEIELDGQTTAGLRGSQARAFRRKIQIVFQDPYRSLNPRRTVGAAVAEGPLNFGATVSEAWKRAGGLMDLVKLSPGALKRYPHEFSVASASASASRVPSRSTRRCSLPTRPSPPWTSRCRRRSSSCWKTSSSVCISPWCSSPMTCGWRRRSAIASWSCRTVVWLSKGRWHRCSTGRGTSTHRHCSRRRPGAGSCSEIADAGAQPPQARCEQSPVPPWPVGSEQAPRGLPGG